jgi:hypothetical protein
MIETERLVPRSVVARITGRLLRPRFMDGNDETPATIDTEAKKDMKE